MTWSTPPSTCAVGTHGSLGALEAASIRPIDETSAEYLLGLDVADQPGVLHAVTGVFAAHGVSIRVAEQEGNGPDARLVFITHAARESDVQATVRELREPRCGPERRRTAARDRQLSRARTSPPAAAPPNSASPTCCSPASRPTAGSTCPNLADS